MTYNHKTKDLRPLSNRFLVPSFWLSVLSFLLLVLSFLFIAPSAQAGTIVKSPAYLGLQTGLIGCWNFDGDYVKVPDCSGRNNTGTLTGGPTKAQGKIGQSLSFDGNSQYVDLGASNKYTPSGTGATISVWIKSTTSSGAKIIAFQRAAASSALALFLDVNASMFYRDASNVLKTLASSITANDGSWHHFVGVINGTSAIVYVDGVQSGTATDVHTANTFAFSSDIASLATLNGVLPFIRGNIDEVRFYGRALSVTEIQRLYQIGLGSKPNKSITSSNGDSLTRGLAGCWNFDGNYTKAPDCSGNNRTGTLTNGPTKVQGKVGQALSFVSASSQYVNLGASNRYTPSGTGATLSAWINATGSQTTPKIAAFLRAAASTAFGIITDNAYFQVYYRDGANALTVLSTASTGISVRDGTWHHVTAVINGTTVIAYIDGVAQASATDVNTANTFAFSSDSAAIASHVTGNFFDGKIDEVRLYNRALSAGEVKRLYDQTQSKYNASQTDSLTRALVGHWTFDGADIGSSDTIAKDKTGNNHGTITGATRAVGKIGQALSFNSNSDSVSLGVNKLSPLLNGASAITGSAWIYTRAHPSSGRARYIFASIEDAGVTGFSISDDGTNFEILARSKSTDGGQTLTVAHPALNEWHHVVGVVNFANATESIYIDGVLVAGPTAKTFGSTTYVNAAPSTPDLVGAVGSAAPSYRGLVDDIRIYNRALSAGEIQKLYNRGR